MKNIIEWAVISFFILVILTFFYKHGMIDFSGIDFIAEKSKEVIQSETGKEITNEFKDIASDVALTLTDETKRLVNKVKLANSKEEVTYIRTVDGDTIVVDMEGTEVTVRLIGVDTPESVNPDSSLNNEYGTLASDYTKSLLSSSTSLYLSFDEESEDQYGRLLAYVWIKDKMPSNTENIGNYMLNGILVKNGYAMDKAYPPNIKFSADFQILRNDAQQSKTGLWKYEDFTNLWN